eukprot:1803499-Amphidinium_carterae.1
MAISISQSVESLQSAQQKGCGELNLHETPDVPKLLKRIRGVMHQTSHMSRVACVHHCLDGLCNTRLDLWRSNLACKGHEVSCDLSANVLEVRPLFVKRVNETQRKVKQQMGL